MPGGAFYVPHPARGFFAYFGNCARFYFYAKDIAPEKKEIIKNKIITKIKTEPKEKNDPL